MCIFTEFTAYVYFLINYFIYQRNKAGILTGYKIM